VALRPRHRLDDMRVGVPHTGHVVVHVDVAPAVGIIEIHTLAAHDVQRMVVEKRRAGTQHTVATFDDLFAYPLYLLPLALRVLRAKEFADQRSTCAVYPPR